MYFCLDVNGGQKILLRLRPSWAPDTFYDEEQLVLVMLHEVLHMAFHSIGFFDHLMILAHPQCSRATRFQVL